MPIEAGGTRRESPRTARLATLAGRIKAFWPARLGWLMIAIPAIGATDAPRGPALAVSGGAIAVATAPSTSAQPAGLPDPAEPPVAQASTRAGQTAPSQPAEAGLDVGSGAAEAAGSPTEPAGPTTAPAQGGTLNTVVVHGRAEDLLGVADTSNQGFVGPEELANRPLLRPAEVLEAVPGLVITQHSGPGKANQYFLRGFQLDHGTDFAVTLDGVPQNLPSHAHGQGYCDLNYLIPELVDNIQYRKGPYSADVGDFSSAGSADIRYVNKLPGAIAIAEAGSYGYARVLLADSAPTAHGNLLYAFELGHEDGPWVRPDAYKKLNAVVKYSEGDADNGLSLTGFGYHGEWRATNQIPQRAVLDGDIERFGSIDPTDAGNSQRYTIVGEAHQRSVDSFANLTAFVSYYDLDLFNDFTYFLYDPVHGDQFEQQDRRVISGLRGFYTWNVPIFGHQSETTFGVQARNDDINNSLHHTEDRVRIGLVEAADILETSCGVYVENRTKWSDKFRTEGSLRGDFYNFNVDANIAANSGTVNTGIFSPKVNFIFGPWDKTEFYVSLGDGFHSNDARGITGTVAPSTLLPATQVTPLTRAEGIDLGVRTEIVPHLQTTATLWGLDLKSEEVFDGDTAETVPSGPSRRYGLELANYYTPTRWLTIDADYSISRAYFTDHEAAGNYVPESIQDVLEAGITIHDPMEIRGLFGSLRLRYFGRRPLTQDDSVKSNSSMIVNAEIGYTFNPVWTLRVDILNLFNTKTNDVEYYYVSRLPGEPAAGVADIHLHPAEPLEVRASLTARF